MIKNYLEKILHKWKDINLPSDAKNIFNTEIRQPLSELKIELDVQLTKNYFELLGDNTSTLLLPEA
jgi:hypothetical protein